MERIPAYEGKQPYLFVSYAHKDSGTVLPVIGALFGEKYRIWYDEGIAPGSEWPKNISTHLEKAAGVIVFVSERSLASINCENEVVRAKEQNKPVVQFSVDGKTHPLLGDSEKVHDEEALKKTLDPKFIGDGSGYDKKTVRNRRSFISAALLTLSILLVGLLSVGILGLNAGWFDSALPGRLPQVEEVMVPPETKEAAGRIDNELLASAILQQLGREDLMREVTTSDGESLRALKRGLYREENEAMTYYDLTTNGTEYLYLDRADDEVLALMKYLPALSYLEIAAGDPTSLTALTDCPYLTEVTVSAELFPLTLPKELPFIVRLR